tara:strand:+ start:316 stop:582 length:267 start_codon:yes stop_codon:yes gene_type:complete
MRTPFLNAYLNNCASVPKTNGPGKYVSVNNGRARAEIQALHDLAEATKAAADLYFTITHWTQMDFINLGYAFEVLKKQLQGITEAEGR